MHQQVFKSGDVCKHIHIYVLYMTVMWSDCTQICSSVQVISWGSSGMGVTCPVFPAARFDPDHCVPMWLCSRRRVALFTALCTAAQLPPPAGMCFTYPTRYACQYIVQIHSIHNAFSDRAQSECHSQSFILVSKHMDYVLTWDEFEVMSVSPGQSTCDQLLPSFAVPPFTSLPGPAGPSPGSTWGDAGAHGATGEGGVHRATKRALSGAPSEPRAALSMEVSAGRGNGSALPSTHYICSMWKGTHLFIYMLRRLLILLKMVKMCLSTCHFNYFCLKGVRTSAVPLCVDSDIYRCVNHSRGHRPHWWEPKSTWVEPSWPGSHLEDPLETF